MFYSSRAKKNPACDLAVYRAGAVGLAELTVRGVPSILIPYPYAAEDHQRYNAQALVMCGAAKMILDKMLTGRELLEEIIHLKDDPKALAAMAKDREELINESADLLYHLTVLLQNEGLGLKDVVQRLHERHNK